MGIPQGLLPSGAHLHRNQTPIIRRIPPGCGRFPREAPGNGHGDLTRDDCQPFARSVGLGRLDEVNRDLGAELIYSTVGSASECRM